MTRWVYEYDHSNTAWGLHGVCMGLSGLYAHEVDVRFRLPSKDGAVASRLLMYGNGVAWGVFDPDEDVAVGDNGQDSEPDEIAATRRRSSRRRRQPGSAVSQI